ncbi:flagellin [Bacillus cereus]|uniref:Flagellin n=1 Tax=Bacillus cereus TaxID=1396 RepID=A0A161T5Z3_BACCE|nr:flagellin [Bacillus cereus]KZD66318.1 Flagellin protein FlaA [Bacillus cereus]HDR8324103.1 flagellin [Bacillus cereus]HDR8328888.1 flagellin [Bacillus cereus]HDR8334322.1 flagellin [Bacillus cereus]
MKIATNISALNTQRSLIRNQNALTKVSEGLASGKRINRAGDDAAGAAVSSAMTSQIRGMKVASRNAADGISLVQTAEGGMASTESILQRMRELAVQSKNGTFSTADRANLDKEFQELKAEITNISDNTDFNGTDLLSATAVATIDLSIGDKGEVMQLTLQKTDLGTLGITANDVTDATKSDASITAIDGALTKLNTARAQMGAYQNRLEYTVDNLGTTSTNLSAARSRIEDADMAELSSDAAKFKVLSQSSIAMLAQSNQNTQMVQQLLQ